MTERSPETVPSRRSSRLLTGVSRGLRRRCPNCGHGALFSGYIAIAEICQACGHNNEQYPSDDFAPYLTIFLVGHLLVPILLVVVRSWPDLSLGLELSVSLPIFLIASVVVLPYAKGAVIGMAWAYEVVRGPRIGTTDP